MKIEKVVVKKFTQLSDVKVGGIFKLPGVAIEEWFVRVVPIPDRKTDKTKVIVASLMFSTLHELLGQINVEEAVSANLEIGVVG